MKKKVSIIVRTKNEERWISRCLSTIFSQAFTDFEVIIVDNKSSDKTMEKAKNFRIKHIIHYKEDPYLPGKALNMGIQKSEGEFIVCLSGHCIPKDDEWLGKLVKNFYKEDGKLDSSIAGVYGRQEPFSSTSDSDKRDLALVFGLDRKVQEKDSFFHNANSMVRKDAWNDINFDEKVTNIEDRVWAGEVLKKGYKIIYEPEASVYHYHGIHQEGNAERCNNVVRILENLHSEAGYQSIEINKMNVVAIVPVKGKMQYLAGKPLVEYTIKRAKESKYIKKIIVSTDNPELARCAEKLGAEVPFLRDPSLSEDHIDLDQVLRYSLNKMEDLKIFPDLIATLEITFPFRPMGLIDAMLELLTKKGLDSVVAAKREYRAIWKEHGDEIVQLEEGLTPRTFKDPTFIELRGVSCVTHPEFLREGHFLGKKIGLYELRDPYSHIEVRDEENLKFTSILAEKWF